MHEEFALSHFSARVILQIQRELLSFQKRRIWSIKRRCMRATDEKWLIDGRWWWCAIGKDRIADSNFDLSFTAQLCGKFGSPSVHYWQKVFHKSSLFQTNASRMLLCSQLFQPDFLWHMRYDMLDVQDAGSKQPKQPNKAAEFETCQHFWYDEPTDLPQWIYYIANSISSASKCQEKVKSNNKTLNDREMNPMNMIKTLECSAVKHLRLT